jgi:flagellar motility protein MotE (MotC chaperone)
MEDVALRLQELKRRLENLIEESGFNLEEEEVIRASRELDKIINIFAKMSQ